MRKVRRRLEGIDKIGSIDNIGIGLCAQGVSVRKTRAYLAQIYDLDVSGGPEQKA